MHKKGEICGNNVWKDFYGKDLSEGSRVLYIRKEGPSKSRSVMCEGTIRALCRKVLIIDGYDGTVKPHNTVLLEGAV